MANELYVLIGTAACMCMVSLIAILIAREEAKAPALYNPCEVLHYTAELEKEVWGEVLSDSVAEHIANCTEIRPDPYLLFNQTNKMLLNILSPNELCNLKRAKEWTNTQQFGE